LKQGYTRSCGCLLKEVTREMAYRHGGRHTRMYAIWSHMKDRCLNPRNRTFKRYGGRGITICQSWKDSFMAFQDDMGPCPPRHTLDRIDNNGPYAPDNCRWANYTAQATNRRTNVWIEWNGERLTQDQWAKRIGVSNGTIRKYWRRHGSLDLAVKLAADSAP
jgi:hypothetical protein